MFNSLSDRLTATFRSLKGKGRLSEADIDATAREIRRALLDADVAVPVVRQFIAQIKERALGAEVAQALNPGQQVVKIVNDALVEMLGGDDAEAAELNLNVSPPAVVMDLRPRLPRSKLPQIWIGGQALLRWRFLLQMHHLMGLASMGMAFLTARQMVKTQSYLLAKCQRQASLSLSSHASLRSLDTNMLWTFTMG